MSERNTTIRRFNINEYARVRLTEQTLRLWREDAAKMRATFPRAAHLWPDEPRTDADGYWRAQLWQIIHLIGPGCVAGGSAIQDCELLLEFPSCAG